MLSRGRCKEVVEETAMITINKRKSNYNRGDVL